VTRCWLEGGLPDYSSLAPPQSGGDAPREPRPPRGRGAHQATSRCGAGSLGGAASGLRRGVDGRPRARWEAGTTLGWLRNRAAGKKRQNQSKLVLGLHRPTSEAIPSQGRGPFFHASSPAPSSAAIVPGRSRRVPSRTPDGSPQDPPHAGLVDHRGARFVTTGAGWTRARAAPARARAAGPGEPLPRARPRPISSRTSSSGRQRHRVAKSRGALAPPHVPRGSWSLERAGPSPPPRTYRSAPQILKTCMRDLQQRLGVVLPLHTRTNLGPRRAAHTTQLR